MMLGLAGVQADEPSLVPAELPGLLELEVGDRSVSIDSPAMWERKRQEILRRIEPILGALNHTIRLTSPVGQLLAGTVLRIPETWLAFGASEHARVLGVFEDGSPALVERNLGEGRCAAFLVTPQDRLTEGDQAELWQQFLGAFLPASADPGAQ